MRTKRSSTEKALEDRVSKVLLDAGFYNHHNDATVMPGIPDRYVVGGRWIEFKRETSIEKTVRALDRQRKWLDILQRAGDKPYVCCLVEGDVNQIFFEPWHVWKLREIGKLAWDSGAIGCHRSPQSCIDTDDIEDAVEDAITVMRHA